jgi:hypothetical protein
MGRIDVLASDELERQSRCREPSPMRATSSTGRPFGSVKLVIDVDVPHGTIDIAYWGFDENALSAPVLGASHATAVIELVRRLERLDDIRELTFHLVTKPAALSERQP